MSFLQGYHHVTISVDGAQEDFDFHTKTLGLHSIKKTVLFDGTTPVYHLYYSNRTGDPSTVVTTFPFRKPGIFGKRGTNQSKVIQLSVPVGSLNFWEDRLGRAGFKVNRTERLGTERLEFTHPCGIPYELVADKADSRDPITSAEIGAEHGIRGIYGAAVAVFDKSSMDDFLTIGMGLKKVDEDGKTIKFHLDKGGAGAVIEVHHEPNLPQGTWTLAGGTIHHLAFNSGDEENQMKLKAHLEGLGFTDVSDQKDRNYFKSCYVRSPGGALFEIAWSVPGGWTLDETPEELGRTLVFPPWFADRKDEMVAGLEPFEW